MNEYVDSDEHRARVYSLHQPHPLLREWAYRDFLEWLERRDKAMISLSQEEIT